MSFLKRVETLAFSADIVNHPVQRQLTITHILPHIARFMADIAVFRTVFDTTFLKAQATKSAHSGASIYGMKTLSQYPTGYCEDIRNGLFDLLKKHPFVIKAEQKGIIFRKVYIILNDSYFQNGIQLGNLWIDVANDTVNPKEARIYYKNLSDLMYENLSDYDTYYTVLEKYLHLSVYPNTLFPNIAPRFPVFALDTEGVCHVLNHQEIILYKDILEQFSLSDQFFKGCFAQRQLPTVYQELITKQLSPIYKEQRGLKKLLHIAMDSNSNLLEKQLSEELFETAIKQETLDFLFHFEMSAISADHHGNWLESIKSKKQPIAPVEVAHRACSTCLIHHVAMKLNRKVYWDPIKEVFKNDVEANAMLSREQRAGYVLK